MKRLCYLLSAVLMMFFSSGSINAVDVSNSQSQVNNNDIYAFHPLNKVKFDDNSIEFKILGYQYLKDPLPSSNDHARILLVKCQINTDDLDSDEAKYAYVSNDFLKIYDNNSEATRINDEFSNKRLQQPPFNYVRDSLSHINENKTYEFDICGIVYPYDDVELKFAPNDGSNGEKIKIHQVKSSNGVVMDSEDVLANYGQEEK